MYILLAVIRSLTFVHTNNDDCSNKRINSNLQIRLIWNLYRFTKSIKINLNNVDWIKFLCINRNTFAIPEITIQCIAHRTVFSSREHFVYIRSYRWIVECIIFIELFFYPNSSNWLGFSRLSQLKFFLRYELGRFFGLYYLTNLRIDQ